MKQKRKINIWYLLYLVFVCIIAAELLLRIYNPFPTGIKGDKIVLRINVKYKVVNKEIPVLPGEIIHSKNSLGFRGPEKPRLWENHFTIFTLGGSTTECAYLNDGYTWSDRLYAKLKDSFPRLWLNNAGLAGHSSFGHMVLLNDYLVKLHPKMVIMLVGCNDIARDDLTESDKFSMKGTYGSVASFFTKNSELGNLLANVVRSNRAKLSRINDRYYNLAQTKSDTISIPQKSMQNHLQKHDKEWLPAYRKRLNNILKISRDNGIDLVLVTQPSLFGEGFDPVSGADLEKYRLYDRVNGLQWWKLMEKYNDVTRTVAEQNNVLLIDLAQRMPKTSLYFYDLVHFTNAGAEKVSEIVFDELLPYLQRHN